MRSRTSSPVLDNNQRKHRRPCGQCDGTGKITQMLDNKQVEVTCPICRGSGQAT
jgi:DnaJ-class molecular chaperone